MTAINVSNDEVDDPTEVPSVPFGEVTVEALGRLKYRYLGVKDAAVYIAIMRLFSSVQLADWAAQEVVDGLERGRRPRTRRTPVGDQTGS